MRARFLGDGDVDGEGRERPCVVYGVTFVPGQWEDVDLPLDRALKLAGNPAFEVRDAPRRPPDPDPDGSVEIPEAWEAMPFLKQKALARKIDPSVPSDARKPDVLTAINREIDRRSNLPDAL